MGKTPPVRLEPDKYECELLAEQNDILAANPDDVVANCNKGTILLDLGRSEEALECFERSLRRDQHCTRAWIGKGRVLTRQENYGGAEECFNRVPEGDESYDEAQYQSARNRRYRDRRGQAQAWVVFANERELDEMERWMDAHLDHIQNLHKLLHKFRCARDGRRRKEGNAFHAWLVREFYEYGGPLKVVAVERDDIEPKTDVDIELSGDVYIQARYGKMPLGYTIDRQLLSDDNTPLDMDWCEELKPAQKKLLQLPSNTGKGFVINLPPGTSEPPSPLYQLCSERKCVMIMPAFTDKPPYFDKPQIIVHGTADFKYCDEACQIARMLGHPVRFVLGDWAELDRQGRNPMLEAAYGFDPHHPPYSDTFHMSKQELLDYTKHVLKQPLGDLAKLGRDDLRERLWDYMLRRDSDCPNN